MSLGLVRTINDLTTDWLTEAIGAGPVQRFATEPIGTGQMSQNHRVTLEYASDPGPSSVVIKVAAEDPTSRATGVGLGAYAREVRFYRELAPRIGGPLVPVLATAWDEADGWFTLLLADIADAEQGDQIRGCTPDSAARALEALARLHAPVFNDPQLGMTGWLNAPNPLNQGLLNALLPGFLERYGDRIDPAHQDLCKTLVASLDGWFDLSRTPPLGLMHGDYRLDNLLFSDDAVHVVDWQTTGWGPVMLDASYFLGGALTVEDRRTHEQDLLRGYHEALIANGVAGYSWEQCWQGYREQCFFGMVMAIAASMLVVRTDRGDAMFMTMLARAAQQAIDTDALALLPSADYRPKALVPEGSEEYRHAPEQDKLWNESWYFDFVTEDGTLGGYVRVGLYPNIDRAWYTTYICGTGIDSIAVVDYHAPLPDDDDLTIETDRLRAAHRCVSELEDFHVTCVGTGESHADPSAFLRGEPGTPVEVGMDLHWHTAGTPYAYRMTTRYEIPCRVTGELTIDGVTHPITAVGQRDHSNGTRDWWALDWVWSAGRLGDETALHAVELRLPDGPKLGVGYVQPVGEDVIEPAAISAVETVAANGLIETAQLTIDDLTVALEPLAWGPLRLEAPDDGRIAMFPRAMCRWTASDGRTGLGWAEWNRNGSAGE